MNKIVFLNIGWMKQYKGLKNDSIEGGGRYVNESGTGWEIFNFLPKNGYYYGYGQGFSYYTINRLGGSEEDDTMDNILVVWVANRPHSGCSYVVGWYKNATLYREIQEPGWSERKSGRSYVGYWVKAKEKDCTLLPEDKRLFQIPRTKTHGKGWMGQSNIWYADLLKHAQFKNKVLEYIKKDGEVIPKISQIKKHKVGGGWQSDPYLRQKVEKKAIEMVIEHYKSQGYDVTSVEEDNIGWDLEAMFGKITLKLEVKGLSGEDVNTELTPNEYEKMKEHKDKGYRICIVTNALNKKPKLKIFSYENGLWEDEEGNKLEFEERKSARVYA